MSALPLLTILATRLPVDGVPDWIVDGVAFDILPSDDGMSAVLQAVGDTIGERATLTVSADADLGEGVVGVRVDEDLQLVSGQATTASFGFGTPRPMPGEG